MMIPDATDISNVFVPTRRVKDAMSLLNQVWFSWRSTDNHSVALVLGPPRSGKTRIAKIWAATTLGVEEFPDQGCGPGVRRIVYVELGPKCSMSSFLGDLLDALGDPAPDYGTWPQKSRRVFGLIRRLKVELVLIDEGQNIIDANTFSVPREIGRWLTELLNMKLCALFIFGEERAEKVFEPFIAGKTQGNDQLEGRCGGVVYLPPYAWDDLPDRRDFRAMLHAIGQRLPLRAADGLSSIVMALRIHKFAQGLIGQAARLIRKACLIAAEKGHSMITMEDFAVAVDGLRIGSARKLVNPFRV